MGHPWFTVEAIDPQTYVISENRHWEQVHSYLLLGVESALLIDTGLGVMPLRPLVEQATTLPVQIATTHVHWDHIGGHGEFDRRGVHPLERPWLEGGFPLPPAVVRANLTREPCDFPDNFSPENYGVYQGPATHLLEDGDLLDLGGRSIMALHTPGHSPGHLCYYEPERQFLFSGDLAYRGKLDAFYPSTDPAAFLSSIRRVAALPVSRLLPGHYSLEGSPILLQNILKAMERLEHQSLLRHGGGIFPCDGFSIHL